MTDVSSLQNAVPANKRFAALYDNLRDNLSDVPDLDCFVLLANDGLALCGYGLELDDVQTIAAACSAMASLADALSQPVGGGTVLHTNVSLEHRHLIITSCGDGSTLIVYTSDPASIGLAMRETVRVARAFSHQMGIEARPDATVQG